ncbi:MAG: tRNA (guanosine(37)-N1)-methyltransferase TrmD, partial [Bdellovibrionales bacterium RIFOXYD1_FULL_44_7]
MPLLNFYYLTLFPEIFLPVLGSSLLGKAQKNGIVSNNLIQLRDFSTDKHRTVDDTPYGGGEGMLLKVDVLYAAWKSVVKRRNKKTLTVLLSPQGQVFDQKIAKELSRYKKIVMVCGHYEGVDERFIDLCVDRELSIGDYVLTGGELPALVLADAITRLLPGVVGNKRSIQEESFEKGLLKYPQYTRPREFKGIEVPEVLLAGNHKAIAKWREEQMKIRTARKRPDLYQEFQGKNNVKQ